MNKRSHTTSGRTRPGAACNFPQPALLIKKREEKEREREALEIESRLPRWDAVARPPRGECMSL